MILRRRCNGALPANRSLAGGALRVVWPAGRLAAGGGAGTTHGSRQAGTDAEGIVQAGQAVMQPAPCLSAKVPAGARAASQTTPQPATAWPGLRRT
jgi:hypothetical protein